MENLLLPVETFSRVFRMLSIYEKVWNFLRVAWHFKSSKFSSLILDGKAEISLADCGRLQIRFQQAGDLCALTFGAEYIKKAAGGGKQ